MAKKLFIVLVAIVTLMSFLSQIATAQSPDTSGQLLKMKHSIITVQDLEQRGLITASEADKAIDLYTTQASYLMGHQMTVQNILAVPDLPQQQLTPLQEFAGTITFFNLLLVGAIVVVGGALIYLFKQYMRILFRILVYVPMLVYELVFYAASLSCALIGWWLPVPMNQSLALLSCVLFAGALALSVSYRRELANIFIVSMILLLVWTPMAILFMSPWIGFFAIGALLSALGSHTFIASAINRMGARVRSGVSDSVEQATLAGFTVLTLFVIIHLLSRFFPVLAVFRLGSAILGGVFGFIGLLLLGIDYREDELACRRYWGFQMASIVAAIGALFFGSTLQISELEKMGGTFLIFYLLVKLLRIPTSSRLMFTWLVLGIGVLTIGFSWFALLHSELFRAWLFLPG